MQPWCLDSWVTPYGSGCCLSVSRTRGAGVTLLDRFVMKHLLCITKNVLVRWDSLPISSNHMLGIPPGRAHTQPPLLLFCSTEGSAWWAVAFLPPFLSRPTSPSEFIFPCHSLHISKSLAPTMFSLYLLWLLPRAQWRRREVTLRSGPWCGYCFSASGKWLSASPVCLRKWAFLTVATFQGRCLCTLQLDHPNWLLCPVDLPEGCMLEPLSHTNPVKLTVPFGSPGDCSPKENITNKSPC